MKKPNLQKDFTVPREAKPGANVLVRHTFIWAGLLLIFLAFTAGCARRQVNIPPEYSSPYPSQQQASRPPETRPEQPRTPEPLLQGPILGKAPEFKKQDIPSTPAVQPPAQAPQQAQPQQKPAQAAAAPPKKQEAESPQLLASMELVNEARGPLNRGKPDMAIPVLERAIQVDVQNAEAFMLLARAWKQKGQKKKALEFAKKAEILYQDEPARLKEVFQLEADLYKELGDNAKASQYRQKAGALR